MSLTFSLMSTACEWKCGSRGRQEQSDVKGGKKNAGKMRPRQKRVDESKRGTHICSHFLTYMYVFCLTQSLTHTGNVSGGLFLTQMNSKSTKALSCFLRIVVAEVAYRFLSSYWQHLCYCEWELAETNGLSQKQPGLIFFHKKNKSKVFFAANPWVHFKNVSHWLLLKSFL